MKKFFIILLLTIKVFSESLTIGIPPWKKEEELKLAHKSIISFLEKRVNKKILFVVTKDYNQLIDKIKSKNIDIAFFTPNLYVKAKREIPNLKYLVTILNKDEKGNLTDHYYSILVSLKSSNIDSLEKMKNKKIGFTDYASTSGYLYPLVALKQNNIDIKKDFSNIFMLKKHSNIFPSLVNKSIDIGATFDTNLDEARAKYGDIFNLILKTPPIPFDAVVMSPHLEDSFGKELIEIFLSADNSIKNDIEPNSPKGFVLRDDSFYNVVREASELLDKP